MIENKDAHLRALQNIFGKERVLHEPLDCFGYSYDASPEELDVAQTPDFVCKAHTTEEVSALLNTPIPTRFLWSAVAPVAVAVAAAFPCKAGLC